MTEKCDTPACLRGVLNKNQRCGPCKAGMPPMTNEKSPHNYTSTTGSQKGKDKPAKEEKGKLVLNKGDKVTVFPSTGDIVVRNKQGKKVTNFKQGKTDEQIQRLQRNAVKNIFTAYWYGWPDGLPDSFKEIFSRYGSFISDRATPSTMKGMPDVHKSTINVAGDKAFILIKEAIYPIEGEAAAFKAIQMSPIMLEKLGEVSPTDAIEMVKNDGEAYTFHKKGNGESYTYEDVQGVTRGLPRWAIA